MAASDALLMTSAFEGVPYVGYEAMAMALPVVAPALAGNVELMAGQGGMLVADRADVRGYVEALDRLIEDPAGRLRIGAEGRERVLQCFTLRQMAEAHEHLYAAVIRPVADVEQRADPPGPLRLYRRPIGVEPMVSVVTPCFNHGRYLTAMLDGLDAQDYPAIEAIIVDDGSTDPQTLALLEAVAGSGRATVIREASNRGSSAARNRGIEIARGRYLLFVDADNVLMPGAVGRLVDQLQRAGERVGFIYPAMQYFGNRDDCFRPPEYNLHDLLHVNFADTCSLFDREVFDSGLRFPEDIELGHEDWDLALQLAARDVIGEPSRDIAVLYRKDGFSRSDLVESMDRPFWREVQTRHRGLFGEPGDLGRWGRHAGPGVQIKNRWNPALSVISLAPLDFDTLAGVALLEAIEGQSCRDFELIAECPRAPLGTVPIRRLPPGLVSGSAERLREAIAHSRGRYLLATWSVLALLTDSTAAEKLLRSFWTDTPPQAIALTDAKQNPGDHAFAVLPRTPRDASLHSLAWPRELAASLTRVPVARDGEELEAILGACPEAQWRHVRAPARTAGVSPDGRLRELPLEPPVANTTHRVAAEAELERRLEKAPAIPAIRAGQVRRWDGAPAWIPTETKILVRHRAGDGSGYLIANERRPPDGYELDFDLGAIHQFSPPGTVRLIQRDHTFLTVPRGSRRNPEDAELGHLEQIPLPLLVGIGRAILDDGNETLVLTTERDHLFGRVQHVEPLGFIEGFPIEPHEPPPRASTSDTIALLQIADSSRRRHRRVAVRPGGVAPRTGSPPSELGCLHEHPEAGSVAVWVDDDDHIWTDDVEPVAPSPSAVTIARWVAAPLAWHGFGSLKGRGRAFARRTINGTQVLLRTRRSSERLRPAGPRLLGYLWADPRPGTSQLFRAAHPALDDTILVHDPIQATDMGYHAVCRLGFIDARAPVTGELGLRRTAVPWASRFGLARRS